MTRNKVVVDFLSRSDAEKIESMLIQYCMDEEIPCIVAATLYKDTGKVDFRMKVTE